MKIDRYQIPTIELYLNGEFVDKIFNEVELVRVQINITKDRLDGYTIKFGDEFISIDSNTGSLSNWPRGMYDEWQFGVAELFKLRRINNEKNL